MGWHLPPHSEQGAEGPVGNTIFQSTQLPDFTFPWSELAGAQDTDAEDTTLGKGALGSPQTLFTGGWNWMTLRSPPTQAIPWLSPRDGQPQQPHQSQPRGLTTLGQRSAETQRKGEDSSLTAKEWLRAQLAHTWLSRTGHWFSTTGTASPAAWAQLCPLHCYATKDHRHRVTRHVTRWPLPK